MNTRLTALAALALLQLAAARMLLEDVATAVDTSSPQDDEQDLPVTPTADTYKWHYELTIAGKPGYTPTIRDVKRTAVSSGCGSDDSKCSCQGFFDMSAPARFVMDGTGTSGTMTGLGFTCQFVIG